MAMIGRCDRQKKSLFATVNYVRALCTVKISCWFLGKISLLLVTWRENIAKYFPLDLTERKKETGVINRGYSPSSAGYGLIFCPRENRRTKCELYASISFSCSPEGKILVRIPLSEVYNLFITPHSVGYFVFVGLNDHWRASSRHDLLTLSPFASELWKILARMSPLFRFKKFTKRGINNSIFYIFVPYN